MRFMKSKSSAGLSCNCISLIIQVLPPFFFDRYVFHLCPFFFMGVHFYFSNIDNTWLLPTQIISPLFIFIKERCHCLLFLTLYTEHYLSPAFSHTLPLYPTQLYLSLPCLDMCFYRNCKPSKRVEVVDLGGCKERN